MLTVNRVRVARVRVAEEARRCGCSCGFTGGRAARCALAFVLAAAGLAEVRAADLTDVTIAAWNRYVAATEQRIERELAAGDRFLVLDFLDDAERIRREALAGGPVIARMETRDERGERIRVRKGAVHHWRGVILAPNAGLEHVVDSLQYSVPPEELQSDVLESRVIERDGDTSRLFLRVSRKAVLTLSYNTEHTVKYVRPGGGRAWMRSVATRIAELDEPGSPAEREKPVGRDRGFLWRMNLYWRYQQVDAGVLIECEVLTLSRSIPLLMRWMIAPIVNRETRSALSDTLRSMAARLGSAAPADGQDGR